VQTGTGCIYLQVRWKRYDRDCHEPEHVYPGEGRGGTLYSEEYMAIQPEDREEDEAEHVRGYLRQDACDVRTELYSGYRGRKSGNLNA